MKQSKDIILEARSLSNSYEGQPLLRNVEFKLRQGDILCLLGPSGSGKTTLLRLIAGLEADYTGDIVCYGRNLRGVPPHKREIGMMFQEYALFPHKDVFHNIAFGLEMQKKTVKEQQEIVQRMLETVGLSGFDTRMVDELSGGERQRVALARSLAPRPQLLLLDEPLGSLDRELRERLTGEVRTILKDFNVASVFVTHDQSEAFGIADYIAILKNGRLEQVATPEELYRQPQNSTVARFLGFKNIFAGNLDGNNNFSCNDLRLHLPESITSVPGPCNLLIRPEGARIKSDDDSGAACLSGCITGRQFIGGYYRLWVHIGAAECVFDLPIDPAPPHVGEIVQLAINQSAMVLLDTGGERP